MSTRYQIWQFSNLLAPGETRQGCDRLYVPKTAHTTGDLNVHDVVLDGDGQLLFVNTDFSCLARLSPDYSFEPIWQPPFITKLVAEDRCHLNGLAMRDGKPAYMSACSTTDTAAGWRDHRVNGGAVLDVRTNEMIATGLSMPHSPRWYQEKLWLLNSGTGALGHVDLQSGQFIPLTFCPGFVRGLAFWQNFAFVGLSKLRAKTFSGLVLEEWLTAAGQTAQCGLMVIDLNTGTVVHWLYLEGVVEELFDVVVLPGVRQPQILGFQSEDIERLVTFPDSGGIVTTKPTVKRPGVGTIAPIAGVPREVWQREDAPDQNAGASPPLPIPSTQLRASPPSPHPPKYQRGFHLNAESLAPYDPFTYPSLQQRWKTQPQRGELLGTSASVDGEMAAFAIAELLPDRTAEIISLFVAPNYRHQGIATRLMAYLERQLQTEGCRQVAIQFEPTHLSALALEPLLAHLGWSEPETLPGGERRSLNVFRPGHGEVQSPSISPEIQSLFNQGKTWVAQGQYDEAIACFQRILDHNPSMAQAHCNLGAIWQIQGKISEAIAAYQEAIALKPDLIAAHLNLAKVFASLAQWQPAIHHYQAVIQIDPHQVEAHYSIGQIALEQGHLDLALRAFQQALGCQPHHALTLFSLGRLYEAQGNLAAARDSYQTLFDQQPDFQNIAAYQLNYVRRQWCDWQDDDRLTADLQQRIERQVSQPEHLPLAPFSLSIFPATPALHRAVNKHYAAHVQRRVAEIKPRCTFEHPTQSVETLRIGYLSPDFCHHPVGLLVQDLFQHHDRHRFQVFAYALRNVEDEVQARIKAGCDEFVDLSALSTEAATRRIHADGIHLLIDLAGYTTHCRPEILALRPAPIQCSYLGYPDTTGAPWIDYLLTDDWVVPPELAAHYSEQVIYLPHQFVVSPDFADSSQLPPKEEPTRQSPSPALGEGFRVRETGQERETGQSRADHNLPPNAFVFCCFNQHRKIDPGVFAVWMRILQQVPDSVLWLSDGPEQAKANLQTAAQQHGIDPNRLIFAPHLPFNQYLARYRCADLFLDTFTYSAGSTAVCALAAGVPLLTKPGQTNASRMGASLCAAGGLDLLICGNTATYEQTAVHLATHPHEVATLRQRLRTQRDTLPLFQPQQWVTNLEHTLEHLWSQTCAGGPSPP